MIVIRYKENNSHEKLFLTFTTYARIQKKKKKIDFVSFTPSTEKLLLELKLVEQQMLQQKPTTTEALL